MSLVGTRVLLFGAAAGIGRGIAAGFLTRHANVYLADQAEERLRATAESLPSAHGRIVGAARCDVVDPSSVAAVVNAATEELGHLDVMVNTAGITRYASFTEITAQDWNDVLNVNLTGAFHCSQAAARVMLGQGHGSIVNVASQAAYRGQPNNAHYGAAKAGLVHLTRTMALELAPAIRVNAVCPGEVETAMMNGYFDFHHRREGVDVARQKRELLESVPLGRFQTPASVAGAVCFLCSEDARDITGQALVVDGGMLA
jgi:NAD(P)-dependent dehydrogenase (short-subunit alcohol dehydrogenase family)